MSWEAEGLVFEEGEGDFEEFVEDGEADGHFGFAGGGEAVGEGVETGVVAAGDHGGHEEHAAALGLERSGEVGEAAQQGGQVFLRGSARR